MQFKWMLKNNMYIPGKTLICYNPKIESFLSLLCSGNLSNESSLECALDYSVSLYL